MRSPRPSLSARAAMILGGLLLLASPASATDPVFSGENTCEEGTEEERLCTTDADCSGFKFATVCITNAGTGLNHCEIPCDAEDTVAIHQCALGERCVEATSSAGTTRSICEKQRFRVDLNLLDLCITHYLNKTSPVFSANECSLERNLNHLLDQNGDKRFDLFDVDLCVLAFLEQRGCVDDSNGDLIPQSQLTGSGQSYLEQSDCCRSNDDCARGTYCDSTLNICQRDCGLIASREATVEPINRQCERALTVCHEEIGLCQTVDVTELSCEVDRDCLAGSYCLLGTCTPNCYRSVDCPDSGWYCAKTNQCRAVPPPEADEGFVFEPSNYTVRFARDRLSLNDIQTFDSSDLAIMDLISNRQIIGNASVGFGFRMEINYGLKADSKCYTSFVDCSVNAPEGETEMECWARQNDCIIDPSEEWIRPSAPFGRINAAQTPQAALQLEQSIADELTPGTYPATLRMIFDNGASDTIQVRYDKKSPSGEYHGQLTVYQGIVENALNGDRTLKYGMRIKVFPEEHRQWNQLMVAHSLADDDDGFVDLTEGQLVHAHLHGESSMAFTRSQAGVGTPDEVHFVGLYSPDQGRLRLVGVIDIARDFKLDTDGLQCPLGSTALCYQNIFERDIRRRLEFVGPFLPASGRFHGIYRETITGLIPQDGLTFEGGFIMDQQSSDDSTLEVDGPIGQKPPGITSFNFVEPSLTEAAVTTLCDAVSTKTLAETDPQLTQAIADFPAYMNQASRLTADNVGSKTPCTDAGTCATGTCVKGVCLSGGVIFPNLVDWADFLKLALNALNLGNAFPTKDNPQNGFLATAYDPLDMEGSSGDMVTAHLSIYDFIGEWVVPDDSGIGSLGTINLPKLKCGMAVYQHALLNPVSAKAINTDNVATKHPNGTEPDLFCYESIPTDGCPDEANAAGKDYKDLFALQDHNRFWLNMAQAMKFQGDRYQSDAFMTLYRNEVNPFAEGAAISYKYDQLKKAIASYDEVISITVNQLAAATLFKFPVKSFKGHGKNWIDILKVVSADRMDAITELVDLERRVFQNADANDFRYAHHLMQQEYLLQAYLMALQSRWQGETFAYRGEAGPILEQGQEVVNRLNPVKNDIGLNANMIFFENSKPDIHNWLGYRYLLVEGYGDSYFEQEGLLTHAKDMVAQAMEEMQNAIFDSDNFQQEIYEYRKTYAEELSSICGSSAPWVYSMQAKGTTDSTPFTLDKTFTKSEATAICQQYLESFDSVDDWIKLRDCKLKQPIGENSAGTDETATCPAGTFYACSDSQSELKIDANGMYGVCNEVMRRFVTETNNLDPVRGTSFNANPTTGDGVNEPPKCGYEGFDQFMLSIPVQGVQRPCVGGEMGAAFSEFQRLQLARRIALNNVQTTLRKLESKYYLASERIKNYAGATAVRVVMTLLADGLGIAKELIENTAGALYDLPGAPNCTFIAGFSIGTDCVGSVVDSVAKTGIKTGYAIGNAIVTVLKYIAEQVRENVGFLFEHEMEMHSLKSEIMEMATELDTITAELTMGAQESFIAFQAIHDLRARAVQAGDVFAEDVQWLSTVLIGRESGHILRGEAMARESTRMFDEILTIAYKMVMGFIHNFNLPAGDASNLVNKVMSLTTLDDVEDLVFDLDVRSTEYCGLAGIDCDYQNAVEVLRFSLRDRLFPGLTDVVDARTGQVLTAGEQFHNTITAPPYMKRRFRGGYVVDQIELPLPLPLTALENGKNGPEWMINPLQCNHYLTGTTHALKVIGQNLSEPGDNVAYELLRGPSDYIRACEIESVQTEIGTLPTLEYPIRNWLIGHAPQNPNSQQEVPPAYTVRSTAMTACIGESEDEAVYKDVQGASPEGEACWRTFARGRSLASLDQKLVIPMWVDEAATGNHWILGDGLKDEERPLIEDIVMLYQYQSRPVTE